MFKYIHADRYVWMDIVVHTKHHQTACCESDGFIGTQVSVDYLVHPQEIFKEMLRVLKPGGMA